MHCNFSYWQQTCCIWHLCHQTFLDPCSMSRVLQLKWLQSIAESLTGSYVSSCSGKYQIHQRPKPLYLSTELQRWPARRRSQAVTQENLRYTTLSPKNCILIFSEMAVWGNAQIFRFLCKLNPTLTGCWDKPNWLVIQRFQLTRSSVYVCQSSTSQCFKASDMESTMKTYRADWLNQHLQHSHIVLYRILQDAFSLMLT